MAAPGVYQRVGARAIVAAVVAVVLVRVAQGFRLA